MAGNREDLVYCTKIVDNQTKRQVHTTALTNFALAGWENFQDSQYTATNKLTLTAGVPVKVTLQQPVLFPRFERQPQIGSTTYPIWDFTNQKVISYNENNLGNCKIRLQFVAEAVNSATGVAVDASLSIPTYLTFYRETKPIAKGTAPQRVTFSPDFYYDEFTLQNGVEIYLTAIGDNIYNISLYLKNW